MMDSCQHHATRAELQSMQEKLERITEDKCTQCDTQTPYLWACLQQCCFFVGCGKQDRNHIGQHCLRNQHHMSGSLKTLQIWCLTCGTKLQEGNEPGNHSRIDDKEKLAGRKKPLLETSMISAGQFEDINFMQRPRGLCGLSNIGNSCYMNSAVQALSNCMPLTQFFMKCEGFIRPQDQGKPNVAILYSKLIHDIWDRKRPKYVIPTAFSKSFKAVYFHFRGCGQQDSQEFLRCLMDRLHEELKRPLIHVPVLPEKVHPSDATIYQGTKLLGGKRGAKSMDVTLPHRDMHSKGRPLLESDSMSVDDSGTEDDTTVTLQDTGKKKKVVEYHSIITDIFDGKLLSSVQCLTCNRVSNKVETFQDLSLPIPGKDDLARIHAPGSPVVLCSPSESGWISTIWDWMKSWFTGPQVALQDCLAAFFASDELKGDNMYNCEKCKKLRNGVKYSRVQSLPEILCIHLKRFRHEMYFSSKISSFVSFPTTGLDMKPFLTKDCPSKVTTYDLTSVITHFGNVGVGHYVAYARNCVNGKWYEFSDSFVTEVPEYSIANAEAYVLFYCKRGTEAQCFRNSVNEDTQMEWESLDGDSKKMCFISKEWFIRFSNCEEPGPITNGDVLCPHGAIHPSNVDNLDSLVVSIPAHVWTSLQSRFGGGPEVCSLMECEYCKEIRDRRQFELDTFSKLRDKFQKETDPDAPANCLSFVWYKKWQAFVKGDELDPPGPIDNTSIVEIIDGQLSKIADAEYGLISVETWRFFVSIYEGGPEVRNGPTTAIEENNKEKPMDESVSPNLTNG